LRTVFLGTSDFAAAVLERLAASDHRPALVLTRPDRPRGRGRRLSSPPVAHTARELEIALQQPERVNDPAVCELVRDTAGDEAVLVVCAFGALVKEPLLSTFVPLNVHPSLLPRWRGAAPVERAIMAGDARTGVSIMRLTAGLDSGPVCATGQEEIRPHDTYGSVAERLQRLGGDLLVGVLDRWQQGQPPRFEEQPEEGVTYAEKIIAEDRLLDPARPAIELERRVRALHPHIGARLTRADGSLVGVLRARVAQDAWGTGSVVGVGREAGTGGEAGGLPTGALVGVGERPARLLYGTSEGALELLEVQPPGGRPMDAGAYLRGHAV
jgi:methionyl-tRNA formyltransferase